MDKETAKLKAKIEKIARFALQDYSPRVKPIKDPKGNPAFRITFKANTREVKGFFVDTYWDGRKFVLDEAGQPELCNRNLIWAALESLAHATENMADDLEEAERLLHDVAHKVGDYF